ESLLEYTSEAHAFFLALQFGCERVDIGREPPLLQHVIPDVLIRGDNEPAINAQHLCQQCDKSLRLWIAVAVADGFIADERIVLPKGHATRPQITAECPTRQGLAGIPFPLAVVEQTAGAELFPQALDERASQFTLSHTQGRDVPFRTVHVVDRDK